MARQLLPAVALVLSVTGARAPAQEIVRVSVSSSGEQGNGLSAYASISADGRQVAFGSAATNLVPGDANGKADVFVHDRQSRVTTLVSVSSSGVQGDGPSSGGLVAAHGRHVAFTSAASNLVTVDTNGTLDVFVHDMQTGETTMVSVDSAGVQGVQDSILMSISAGGRYVAFHGYSRNLVAGDTNGSSDVFVHDRQSGQTSRASVGSTGAQGNGDSFWPSLSADGRYVAFFSSADDLVPQDTNGSEDVFVHDRQTLQTKRVSVSSTGIEGDLESLYPSISGDGRRVAFGSRASNLIPGDTNGWHDIFVHDLRSGETERVSVSSSGGQANNFSTYPSISASGRYVAFASYGSNLVPGGGGGRNVFVHDRHTGETVRASSPSSGGPTNGPSDWPSLSADGRFVSFSSRASNLIPGDTNGETDIFVRDRGASGDVASYCTSKVNSQLCSPAIAGWGTPRASGSAPFTIDVRDLVNQKSGLFFYGFARAAVDFQGGLLCVRPPLRRTAVQNSGGNPPPNDCSGTHSLDFNAVIRSGGDPALVPGAVVRAQYWGRDPGDWSGFGSMLSDALELTIQP